MSRALDDICARVRAIDHYRFVSPTAAQVIREDVPRLLAIAEAAENIRELGGSWAETWTYDELEKALAALDEGEQ